MFSVVRRVNVIFIIIYFQNVNLVMYARETKFLELEGNFVEIFSFFWLFFSVSKENCENFMSRRKFSWWNFLQSTSCWLFFRFSCQHKKKRSYQKSERVPHFLSKKIWKHGRKKKLFNKKKLCECELELEAWWVV